jgi:dipeptide/tripeptide permease
LKNKDCYPLAYGIATGVLIISFVIFMGGSPFYRKSIHDGEEQFAKKENVLTQNIKCVYSALKNRFKDRKNKEKTKKDHWLDYADESYSKELTNGVKILFRIIVVFLPLPLFWGVYEQQYSRWVLQGNLLC